LRGAGYRRPGWLAKEWRGGTGDQAWRSMARRDVGCCGATGLAGWSGRRAETGWSGQEVGGEQAAAMRLEARVEVESGSEG